MSKMHAITLSVKFTLTGAEIDPRLGCVLVRFREAGLDRLETDATYSGGWPPPVVTAFRKRMQQIRAALDEREFYSLKSLHFEKLKGDMEGMYSMRLNDQWRLLLTFEDAAPNKVVVVLEITDYH